MNKDTSPLLPSCAYCGETVEVFELGSISYSKKYWYWSCPECGINRQSHCQFKTKEQAIADASRRPAPASPSAPDAVEADTALNHEEAEQLAHLNKGKSNLARCYLDLRAALSQPKAPSAPEFHQLRLVSGERKTELLVTGLELLKTKAPEIFLENRLNELFALHVRYLDHVRRSKAPPDLVVAGRVLTLLKDIENGTELLCPCCMRPNPEEDGHLLDCELKNLIVALSHNGERSGPPDPSRPLKLDVRLTPTHWSSPHKTGKWLQVQAGDIGGFAQSMPADIADEIAYRINYFEGNGEPQDNGGRE